MAESQGKGLKTPVNGLFHKNFEFEPLFGYDNFQNKIDTWETLCVMAICKQKNEDIFDLMGNLRSSEIF